MRVTVDHKQGVVEYEEGRGIELNDYVTASMGIAASQLSASSVIASEITSPTIDNISNVKYVTTELSSFVPEARILSPGTGITFFDGGPGGLLENMEMVGREIFVIFIHEYTAHPRRQIVWV